MLGLGIKIAAGLLATAGTATAVTMSVAANEPDTQQATVVHQVDGDTLDVQIDGQTKRIRLLNINTPETKDPNHPVQCLGPEAAAFLANLVPVGSTVRLEYDQEREDGYGRTLAAAFTSDGRMVNAEIARAGLAQVITVGGNDRFRPPVEQAAEDAAANHRGMHSPDVQCTVPAQVLAASSQVSQAPTLATQPAASSSAQLTAAADRSAVATLAALTVMQFVNNPDGDLRWLALTAAEQALLRTQAASSHTTATQQETALRTAAATAKQQEDAAAYAAAQAQTARVAEQQRAAFTAQQARATAPKKDTDDNDGGAGTPSPSPKPKPKPQPKAGKSGNPSGYTGPRCYAPGGKTWRPC